MPKHQDNVDKVITAQGTRVEGKPVPFFSVAVNTPHDTGEPAYAVIDSYTADWQTAFAQTLPSGGLSLCTDVQIHTSAAQLSHPPPVTRWTLVPELKPIALEKKVQYQWCSTERLLATLQLGAALDGKALEVVPDGSPQTTIFRLRDEKKDELATVTVSFLYLKPDAFCIRELRDFKFAARAAKS